MSLVQFANQYFSSWQIFFSAVNNIKFLQNQCAKVMFLYKSQQSISLRILRIKLAPMLKVDLKANTILVHNRCCYWCLVFFSHIFLRKDTM